MNQFKKINKKIQLHEKGNKNLLRYWNYLYNILRNKEEYNLHKINNEAIQILLKLFKENKSLTKSDLKELELNIDSENIFKLFKYFNDYNLDNVLKKYAKDSRFVRALCNHKRGYHIHKVERFNKINNHIQVEDFIKYCNKLNINWKPELFHNLNNSPWMSYSKGNEALCLNLRYTFEDGYPITMDLNFIQGTKVLKGTLQKKYGNLAKKKENL